MKPSDSNEKSGLVVKSNTLINAMVSMSLQGNRFLAFAISLLDRNEEITPGQDVSIEVPVAEFADMFDIPKTYVYREIEVLADQLQRKIVQLQPTETASGRRVKVGLITKQEYLDGAGRVWLKFDSDIVPHLLGLKSHFTSYELKNVYQFTSAHTWRVYESLKQYKQIGKREIETDELRRLTDTVGKYARIADFRRYVVNSSLEELNGVSDIMAEYSLIKRGRRITGFLFIIRDNPHTKTPREKIRAAASKLDDGKSRNPELEAVLCADYGVSKKQARQIANLAGSRSGKILAKLPAIKARFEKLKDKKTSLGGYVFRSVKSHLDKEQQGDLPL